MPPPPDTPAPPSPPPSPPFLIGDVNNDGTVNVLDLVALNFFITGQQELPGFFGAADINQDGILNIIVRATTEARG